MVLGHLFNLIFTLLSILFIYFHLWWAKGAAAAKMLILLLLLRETLSGKNKNGNGFWRVFSERASLSFFCRMDNRQSNGINSFLTGYINPHTCTPCSHVVKFRHIEQQKIAGCFSKSISFFVYVTQCCYSLFSFAFVSSRLVSSSCWWMCSTSSAHLFIFYILFRFISSILNWLNKWIFLQRIFPRNVSVFFYFHIFWPFFC